MVKDIRLYNDLLSQRKEIEKQLKELRMDCIEYGRFRIDANHEVRYRGKYRLTVIQPSGRRVAFYVSDDIDEIADEIDVFVSELQEVKNICKQNKEAKQ